jgi:hypothetical protein
VEVCPETELIAIEDPATVCDGSFEIGEGREVLVGERLVENRPKVFSRLQFGGVARQVDEPDTLGHDQVRRSVPAGVVEQKRDNTLASRPGLAGKQGQERGEERLGHPVRHVPEGLARGRLDEGGDVQPLVAVVAEGAGPLTLGGPHPSDDRLQPDPVLIRGPDLDGLVRVLGRFLRDDRGQLFLNASRSSGVAA